MKRAITFALGRIALYVAAILGLVLVGVLLDAKLAHLLGWSQSMRDGLPHFVWTVSACVCAGAGALRLLRNDSEELL